VIRGRVVAVAVAALVSVSLAPVGPAAGGRLVAQEAAPALTADVGLFWLSSDPAERASAAERLASSRADPIDVFAALRAVPAYRADAPTGRLDRRRSNADGRVHPYTVLVPESYDPARAWPVLVYLHGGIGRPSWKEPGGWWREYTRVADPDRIVVIPAGWAESTWWQESQVENLTGILEELGREYRLDRNRVHLLGISDGGTGAYYHAFRAPTPWASFLIFIGHPAVLSSPRLAVEGQMYVANLRNRSLFIVSGGRDRLYPTSSVESFISLFRDNGVDLVYRPQPEAGHDLSWLASERARIDSFLVATPRDPLPDRLEWETEAPGSGAGRFAWVVIDSLGTVPGESDLADRNELTVDGRRGEYLAFPHRLPSGRLEVEKEGNLVHVRTERVARFRLLISPEAFDLSRAIRVEVNGEVRFDARVVPSVATMLEWAARDDDREMVFVAEIEIDLTRV